MTVRAKSEIVIHKQQQLTPTSCVPACMAMISGVDQQSIIDELAAKDGQCGSLHNEFRQWVRMGYLPSLLPYNELIHGHGQVMLATVPSLNFEGGNHRVVFDFRDIFEVIDPNEGRDGRKFYTRENLVSWSELTIVEKV